MVIILAKLDTGIFIFLRDRLVLRLGVGCRGEEAGPNQCQKDTGGEQEESNGEAGINER